ncbi:Sec20-domain-containing protein [Favolaschia claudopus]|uniref:Sec20-domain-containing protein n=1 Tax=Favolaschia claudopus TaxID=2862362 RepID=A0AAW0CZK9_9AGAR
MAPLPNTFDDETLQLIATAQRHEKDLAEFQIPRLRACKGPLSTQQNLASEMREDMDTFGRHIETLDFLVDDQKGPKNRRELRDIVDGLKDSLANLRREGRTALLESKRTIDSLSKSHREELLTSSAVSEKHDTNEKVSDDALMAASDNVTEAMQRTMALMQGELERSVLSSQMLADSTATLRSASSTHDTLTTVMDTSKQLITAMEKADWLDRILVFSALAFFLLVVLFILKQRIFDRGMRFAFWWTRFIPDFSGDDQLLSMEKGSATALSSTIATSVTSAASILASSSPVEPSVVSESTLIEVVSDIIDVTDTSTTTPDPTVHVEL